MDMRLYEITAPRPTMTPDDLMMFEDHMKATYDLLSFTVQSHYLGDIVLASIVVRDKKQGTGTAVMQELCKFADHYGKRILLSPNVKDIYYGTTSRSRLVRFYKRFGFVENKGRNRDFRIGSAMIRNPA
jgi:GNAT superfamily N-acetyltransferase